MQELCWGAIKGTLRHKRLEQRKKRDFQIQVIRYCAWGISLCLLILFI